MKVNIYSKYFLITILLIFFAGFLIIQVGQLNKQTEKNTLTPAQIELVNSNFKKITESKSNPMSSNPYDKIKANKKEYDEIIKIGDPVVDFFISEFKKGNLNDSNYWIAAWICNDILGDKNPVKIWAEDNANGWSTGDDWFEKYLKLQK